MESFQLIPYIWSLVLGETSVKRYIFGFDDGSIDTKKKVRLCVNFMGYGQIILFVE